MKQQNGLSLQHQSLGLKIASAVTLSKTYHSITILASDGCSADYTSVGNGKAAASTAFPGILCEQLGQEDVDLDLCQLLRALSSHPQSQPRQEGQEVQHMMDLLTTAIE